jgi:hypothetical protein
LVLIDPELSGLLARVREVFVGIVNRLTFPPSITYEELGEMGVQREHLAQKYALIIYVGPTSSPNEVFGQAERLLQHVCEIPIFYLPRGFWELRTISSFLSKTLNIPLKERNCIDLSTKL